MTEEESMIPKRDQHMVNLAQYEKELFSLYIDLDKHPEYLTVKKLTSLSEQLREISIRMNHSFHKSYDDFTPIGYEEWKYLFKLRNEIGNYYFFKMVEMMKEQN